VVTAGRDINASDRRTPVRIRLHPALTYSGPPGP
jgi:hypothetical protein